MLLLEGCIRCAQGADAATRSSVLCCEPAQGYPGLMQDESVAADREINGLRRMERSSRANLARAGDPSRAVHADALEGLKRLCDTCRAAGQRIEAILGRDLAGAALEGLLRQSPFATGRDGGTGRRSGLKIRRPLRSWGFDPPSRHQDSKRLIVKTTSPAREVIFVGGCWFPAISWNGRSSAIRPAVGRSEERSPEFPERSQGWVGVKAPPTRGDSRSVSVAADSWATRLGRKWKSALLVNADDNIVRRVLNSPEAMATVARIAGWRAPGDNMIETIIIQSEKGEELKNKTKVKGLAEKQKRRRRPCTGFNADRPALQVRCFKNGMSSGCQIRCDPICIRMDANVLVLCGCIACRCKWTRETRRLPVRLLVLFTGRRLKVRFDRRLRNCLGQPEADGSDLLVREHLMPGHIGSGNSELHVSCNLVHDLAP